MRVHLSLLLLLAASAAATTGIMGPPDYETQPLRSDALTSAMKESQGILQATAGVSDRVQDFTFQTGAKPAVEEPSLMEERAHVSRRQSPGALESASLVEESAELHHGVSHHLRSLDGLKLHTKADVQALRVYSRVGLSFIAQFVMENYPHELPMDALEPVLVEEEEEVEESNVDHGESGRMSDREARRQWRKMNRGKQRFQERASRRERGRVPSEFARDANMPVFLEEQATALDQVDIKSRPSYSESVMVELGDQVRAHGERNGVLEKLKLMTYGKSQVDSTADDTEDQRSAPSGIDPNADTESLSGGITPYEMHNTEVRVNAEPETVQQPRFQEVAAKDEATDKDSVKFFGAIGRFVKKAVNKVKSFFGGKKKKEEAKPAAGGASPKIVNEAAALEDCTGCRMVWEQVELDVGNARYIEDIQASFEHNCMDAQKSTIFYAVCEDMYDDMYALTDDYMSNKYKVLDMCKRGKYCKAG